MGVVTFLLLMHEHSLMIILEGSVKDVYAPEVKTNVGNVKKISVLVKRELSLFETA